MQLTEANAFREHLQCALCHVAIHICFVLLPSQQSAKFGITHPILEVRKLMLWNIRSPIHGYINRKVGESNLNKANQISQRLGMNKLISEFKNNKNIKISHQILTLPPRIAALCPWMYWELYPSCHRNDLV